MDGFQAYSNRVLNRWWQSTRSFLRRHVLPKAGIGVVTLAVGFMFAHWGLEHETAGSVMFGLAVLGAVVLLVLLFNLFMAPYRIHQDQQTKIAALEVDLETARDKEYLPEVGQDVLDALQALDDSPLRIDGYSTPRDIFSKCSAKIRKGQFTASDIYHALYADFDQKKIHGWFDECTKVHEEFTRLGLITRTNLSVEDGIRAEILGRPDFKLHWNEPLAGQLARHIDAAAK